MANTDFVLEADLIPRDDTSGEEASLASSNTSLAESVFDYRTLHGRPYKVTETTEYWAPVDAVQNSAFDILHNAQLIALDNKLFQSPLGDELGKVLEIGTGTGMWVVDLAHQYPTASVTGTDITATQPAWIPPNSTFVVEDCLLDWSWPPNHFDFIHIRALYGCVPDWTALYEKAFKHLKPGGWFEHAERGCRLESDHVAIPDDHIFNKWAELAYSGGEKMGRSFSIAEGHQMKEFMEKAGFVDVHERKIKLPLHGWPKNANLKSAGYLGQLALDQSLDGLSTFLFTQVHGWSREEALAFTEAFRKESRKITNYPWIWITIVWGRKPT
ncbi:S-adenosyl-L-methionine-dependent methyltransferase [Cercophora newfieldiana]|uniref:S-adenosyl-L-methionine-dependent methyltransferase n=1 Tax=Cercophora newfieldiana TaxID=92897 RepID=A0AA39YBW9_9PEZI|nr:S-adenosyl-L-methionine-dependent methyltransferase [Cercophora newfieldiana]